MKDAFLNSCCVLDSTCEGHLGVAVHALLLDAVLVGFGASPRSLHVAKILTPPLPTGVFLQPFLFRSPVLKPNLEGKMKRCIICQLLMKYHFGRTATNENKMLSRTIYIYLSELDFFL